MSPCILWGDIFCWRCGDLVVRRKDVRTRLEWGSEVEWFCCGEMEIFRLVGSEIFRMSVVE